MLGVETVSAAFQAFPTRKGGYKEGGRRRLWESMSGSEWSLSTRPNAAVPLRCGSSFGRENACSSLYLDMLGDNEAGG